MTKCQTCVEATLRRLLKQERLRSQQLIRELREAQQSMFAYPHEAWAKLMTVGNSINPKGEATTEVLNVSFSLNPESWLFDYEDLPINEDYVRTELKWYLNGEKSDLSICDAAQIWKNMVDEKGEIQSNYGAYFHAQGFLVVEELKRDSASRRAVIKINQTYHRLDAPDVPCTLTMQYMIRGGRLHAFVNMRSQDAVFGLRNDIPCFQMFKLYIADALGIAPGYLYLNVASFHVYERHYEKLRKFKRSSGTLGWNVGLKITGFKNMGDFYTWLSA